jgi:hypothetical protein
MCESHGKFPGFESAQDFGVEDIKSKTELLLLTAMNASPLSVSLNQVSPTYSSCRAPGNVFSARV